VNQLCFVLKVLRVGCQIVQSPMNCLNVVLRIERLVTHIFIILFLLDIPAFEVPLPPESNKLYRSSGYYIIPMKRKLSVFFITIQS